MSEADPIRVLVVDDQDLVRGGFKAILGTYEGIELVGEALNGADAVQEAQRLRPDVVLMDIRMPEMRGDEFLAYLKLNELFKQIPVVMLSSEDSTSERIRLLEEGAEDYIVKPFNPQELKIRIKKILD